MDPIHVIGRPTRSRRHDLGDIISDKRMKLSWERTEAQRSVALAANNCAKMHCCQVHPSPTRKLPSLPTVLCSITKSSPRERPRYGLLGGYTSAIFPVIDCRLKCLLNYLSRYETLSVRSHLLVVQTSRSIPTFTSLCTAKVALCDKGAQQVSERVAAVPHYS